MNGDTITITETSGADSYTKDIFTGNTYRGDQLMNFGLHAPTTLEFHSILWILEKQ